MTDPRKDNVLIVHWHDLGRYLGVYGHADVASPRLDQLTSEDILFSRARATAPLCSPSRGSLFTGRYPHRNGLVGLTQIVGDVLETLGQDRRLAPAPVLERQADQRSDEWVDRYRAEAEQKGLPT
jgi:arylsulfatase A-like enzyme